MMPSTFASRIPLASMSTCLLFASAAPAQIGPSPGPDPSVTIDIHITDADSIVVRQDVGSPGGGATERPTVKAQADAQNLANDLRGMVSKIQDDLRLIARNRGGAIPQEKIDQANAAILQLSTLQEIVDNAANNLGDAAPLFAVAAVNNPDQGAVEATVDALRELIFPDRGRRISDAIFNRTIGAEPGEVDAISQTAKGFFTAIGKTDPFVAIRGEFTNDSATDILDVFLNFEQGLFEALPLDSPLQRQLLLDVQVEDTNGDGVAAARSASFGFSAFGTNEPENPTLQNTRSLGIQETLFDFIGDSNDDSIEEGIRLIEGTAPVDLSAIQFDPSIPEDTLITHLIGGLTIEDLSPGDTVRYTAILSVGIDSDAAVPLLPVQNLEALFDGSALVAEFRIPEPNSLALLSLVSLGWIRRR